MAIKTVQNEKGIIYFCTFTCINWMSLIELTALYDAIYNWFELLKAKNNPIVGYVIMPNHVHLLIYISKKERQSLNQIIGNGKRFLAYEVIKRLERQKEFNVLDKLKNAVTLAEKKRGKKHRVFNVSFDAKACYSGYFLRQKMAYIHKNPINGKWKLAKTYSDYNHSSARFYETGIHAAYSVVNWMDVFEEE